MGIFDRIADQLGELIAPDDVRAHVDRGVILLDEGDLDGATRAFSQALSRVPDHTRAATLLGAALARKGELDGAERAYEQALTVRPELADARLGLAEVQRRQGRGDAALESFRRALDDGLSDARSLAMVYRGRGAIHLAAGRPDKALRELRKAAAALPADGEVNRLLGGALIARGDLDRARICLEKAVAADDLEAPPVRARGRALLAEVYRRLDRRAEAAARLEGAAAADLDQASPLVALARARLLVDGGDAAAARAELSRALASPEATDGLPGPAGPATGPRAASGAFVVELHRSLARAEAAVGDVGAALGSLDEALRQARALRPRRAPASATKGALIEAEIVGGDGRAPQPADEGARAAAPPEHEAGALDPFVDEALTLGAAALESDAARSARILGLLDEALHLALRSDRDAVVYAEAILDLRGGARAAPPRSSLAADALAALALGRLAAGDLAAAQELSEQALRVESGGGTALGEAADTVETRLAAARVELARGRIAAAAAHLRLASSRAPADPRPRALLGTVYRREHEPTPPNLESLLGAALRQLQRAPETSDLAPAAARIVEVLDRPLLLTVMGEFNAGKSTFVNALLGEQVAPMGITPTTATINVLKYGAEPGGRVVYRDETVRRVAWSDVPALLRALDDAEAARIAWVEVLYPLETLQRVNIVDTPGLNSIRPEHESTARAFIAQADAIIWLFSCRQPGTASELEALGRVRAEGKKALGVVNMIDLAPDEEARAEVLTHLQRGFGDLVEALVPFSAREALLGRGDPERLRRSNRVELERVLEERFYARAKAIQREVATRRISALLDEAQARAEGLLSLDLHAQVTAARARGKRLAGEFSVGVVDSERQKLVDRLADLYAQAGREVLDFVKPRRWAFGANEAEKADRDFVVALVEEQLHLLADGSRARMAGEVARAMSDVGAVAEPDGAALVAEELRVLDEQVYGRYRAFARGFLRGGRVDEFFKRALPKLELGEQAIQRALLRDMPALEVLDEELVAPLRAWIARFFENLDARLVRLLREDELRRFELEERLVVPLATLRASIASIAAAAPRKMGEAAKGGGVSSTMADPTTTDPTMTDSTTTPVAATAAASTDATSTPAAPTTPTVDAHPESDA